MAFYLRPIDLLWPTHTHASDHTTHGSRLTNGAVNGHIALLFFGDRINLSSFKPRDMFVCHIYSVTRYT
jgi:hypothetical protein